MEIEQALSEFYTRHRDTELFSTGLRVVDYAGFLYNIEGSSPDPRIDRLMWKQLLIRNGIEEDCYVTDPLPDGETSHADFSVGGHMTPSDIGHVEPGGICYLMPLCHWHNNPARNRTPFEHTATRMLELSGYMEGDLAATFEARRPGGPQYRLVSVEGDALTSRAIEEPMVTISNVHRDTGVTNPALPSTYLRFRRVEEGGEVRFVIDDARLPILG